MILVKLINNGCSSPPEWAAIEVQGELESRHHNQLECQYVGDLFATIKDNVPILIIGHHILYGKMQAFEKPLAVMRKKEGETEEYIVQAIVTKKLLFKDRPKPIIANVKKS